MQLRINFRLDLVNPLVPGVGWKVTQVAAGLFKYVWSFSRHQTLNEGLISKKDWLILLILYLDFGNLSRSFSVSCNSLSKSDNEENISRFRSYYSYANTEEKALLLLSKKQLRSL